MKTILVTIAAIFTVSGCSGDATTSTGGGDINTNIIDCIVKIEGGDNTVNICDFSEDNSDNSDNSTSTNEATE